MDFTKIFDFVGDIPDAAKYVAALIFVLILILLVGWVLRKISTKAGKRGRDGGRLKIGESIALDSQRTLTLVSCDDVEHLILLGDSNDLVIAANINTPGSTVNQHGFSDTGDRIAETPAPVQAAVQPKPAPPARAISSQQPIEPEPLPLPPTRHQTEPEPQPPTRQAAEPEPQPPTRYPAEPVPLPPTRHPAEPVAVPPTRHPAEPVPLPPTRHPAEPVAVPPTRHPAPYREPSRNTAVQALAKPAPRPRPSTLPPGPGRRGPETRPRPVPPVPPAHSDASQLNGEEGIDTENATSQSFAEIRPGDEK